MGARALGGNEEQNISAGVSVATTHHAESKRLCGPSPVVPHISDPVRGVFRSKAGREDRVCNLWWTGRALVLLAVDEVSNSLPVGVVDRVAFLRAAVSVSDEHGQSAAVRDHLPDHRDSSVFQTKILAIAASRARFYLDLRSFRPSRDGNDFLGHRGFRNGIEIRMAAAGLRAGGLCCGSRYQSIFSTQPPTVLRTLTDQAHCKRLRNQSRFGMVSLRLVGVPGKLDHRMYRDVHRLYHFRPFRNTTSSLRAL